MIISQQKSSKLLALMIAVVMLLTCFTIMPGSVNAAGGQPAKDAYRAGDDIGDAVFYIMEDVDNNGKYNDGDNIYYYSEQEIKDYDESVIYSYDNHSQGENIEVKGAKLTSLLCNLSGSAVNLSASGDSFTANNPGWLIQYMEYDGYHVTATGYQDTVKELYDSTMNSGGYAGPANTIVGYCGKTTFDNPDANNINDKDFVSFSEYSREASPMRGYRQTTSANSSVLKMMMGVVISSGKSATKGKGYTIEQYAGSGKTDEDFAVQGLVEGMNWAVKAPNIGWAALASTQTDTTFDANSKSITITIENDMSQLVRFDYTENKFFSIDYNGENTRDLVRSDIADSSSVAYPRSKSYTYFGYNKPMYVRYQGTWLDNYLDLGSGHKVFMVTEDNKVVDITNNADDYFIAYYYTESKSSTNISNSKRVPINYSYATLVDTKSAPVEYSNDGSDYTSKSGKTATEYYNARIVVADIDEIVNVKASATAYNTASLSWTKSDKASGYQIYRSDNDGAYKLVKEIAGSGTVSYADKTLKPGTTYKYKVIAYKNVSGVKAVSGDSNIVVVKPILKKTSTPKIKKTKKNVKVSYKKVDGANGYQIVYGTNKKITKGKKSVLVRKGTTTSKKFTKLKKGKRYYFKVRAYKTVNGKKVYGAYSKIKSVKR